MPVNDAQMVAVRDHAHNGADELRRVLLPAGWHVTRHSVCVGFGTLHS